MFEHVLVPLDESAAAEQVLPHVVMMARLGNPTVTLVRVMEPPTSAGVEHATDPVDWQLALDRARSYITDVQRRLADAGVVAKTLVIEGDPATAILQLVRERGVDLLALTTHGRGGMLGHSLGSVASKTLMRTRTNVLLVRSHHAARGTVATLPEAATYSAVVVPLDGSLRAEAALPLAARIGKQVSVPVLLVHCVEFLQSMRGHLSDDAEAARRASYRESQQAAATEYLEQTCRDQGNDGLTVSATVVGDGDVPSAIESSVGDATDALMVLVAHGESGSTRWPYGSTTLHTLVYGGTTVLIVQDRQVDELLETHTERAARERQGHG